MASDTFCLQVL
uniref:Uncharacterized protein n=1 Tax=Anguilla anguilla TaxID=7936 RepID=A0A0E9Q763_ANGAN